MASCLASTVVVCARNAILDTTTRAPPLCVVVRKTSVRHGRMHLGHRDIIGVWSYVLHLESCMIPRTVEIQVFDGLVWNQPRFPSTSQPHTHNSKPFLLRLQFRSLVRWSVQSSQVFCCWSVFCRLSWLVFIISLFCCLLYCLGRRATSKAPSP